MRFKLLLIGFAVFGMLFMLGSEARAASSSSILVEVVPPNPAPNENVTINLNSYANNLDSVLITWFVNGKNSSSGIGKKSFSLKAPASGSESDVVAHIALPEGNVETRVVVRPGVMVLLWQADDSYVPPFYKGKAMATDDSEIKIVAMPELRSGSTVVSPKNMTYVWKKDYTNDQAASGYGKNFFTYTNDFLERGNTISVTVETVDGQSSSDGSVTVDATDPEIIFYSSNKNIGTVWEQALRDAHQVNGDETVVAIPYFLSPKNILNPILQFKWSINDSPVNILGIRKNVIPLKVQEGVSGTSKLRLEIENKGKIFQSTSKEIFMEF